LAASETRIFPSLVQKAVLYKLVTYARSGESEPKMHDAISQIETCPLVPLSGLLPGGTVGYIQPAQKPFPANRPFVGRFS
jgi:hypothetical protein